MNVRRLVREPKILQGDTLWRVGEIAPRFAPIFVKTRPMPPNWRWRSVQTAVRQDGSRFVVLAQCCAPKGQWKAWLMLSASSGASIVVRLENHDWHPGLHIHTDCERAGVEVGLTLLSELGRRPASGARHRRQNAWTDDAFWVHALRFFRVWERQGRLL